MANFGSFWVGKPLSKVEQTALASYIYHGHTFTLYVYDMDLAVPNGVIKLDANTMIPESEIFKVENSYGPFADLFRYKMLAETELIWTDTDSICLRPDWDFGDYIFGYEEPGKLSNSVLRAPGNSPLAKQLLKEAFEFDRSKIVWSEIGPQLITRLITELGLSEHVQEPNIFYPVHYWQWETIWNRKNLRQVLDLCEGSYTLQIWNQFLNRNDIDKNKLPQGSAIAYFYDKYVLLN